MSEMTYRPLGTSGLMVSTIGLGTNAFVLLAPPCQRGLAVRIALQQPRDVGFDDRQAAHEAGLGKGGAKGYRRGEADEVDGSCLQPAHDGDQVVGVGVGRVLARRGR